MFNKPNKNISPVSQENISIGMANVYVGRSASIN